MPCPSCAADDPGDAKFCLRCGARLAVTCAACGTPVTAGAAAGGQTA